MRHYINGIEVTPANLGEIGIRYTNTNQMDELSVNVDRILLKREDYSIITNHMQQVGPFEGIPYTMVTNAGISIEYFINLKEEPIFRTYEVELKLMKRGGTDHFWSKANGTSFELIAKTVNFPVFDTPYVIIKDHQAEMAVSLFITLFLMTKEAIDSARQLIESISDLIGAVTPNVGAGITMDIGDIITQVIKIIFQIAYLALLISALIKLSQQLFAILFPKIRYLKACKVKELLRVGIESLGMGLSFSSTALDSLPGLTVLPIPLKKQSKRWFSFAQNDLNQSFNKGYPTASDTTPTVGALLEGMRVAINGKVRIIGNTVHLERRDYWSSTTTNMLMPALALQDTRQDEYRLNTNESWKRFYIRYISDITDLHTFDNFEGVDAEYSAEPVNVVNSDLISLTGVRDVQIPFALGARKDQLNWLEKQAKELFRAIDNLITSFGGNSSLTSKIDNRIGVTMISQQYFNTTKLLYTVGGKQPADYLSKIRASSMFNQFHTIERIEVNGHKLRASQIRINDQDFVSLLQNNFASMDGIVSEIDEFDYIEDDHVIEASYREPFNYAAGLVNTIIING